MIVTIVGAGNAGCAYAAHLGQNHEVRILKTSNQTHNEAFQRIQQDGFVTAHENGNTFTSPLSMVTRDEREALNGAEVVIVLTQTTQHKKLAERLGPLMCDAKLVLVIPGYMGSMYFQPYCPGVLLGEGESTALDARLTPEGEVNILFRNVRNALGFLPSSRSYEGLSIARQLFDTYVTPRKNILESALYNPNLTVHTLGTILSASRIEKSGGEFRMYREAFSPSVWRVAETLDSEKNRILQVFDCEPFSYVDACKWRNEEDLSRDSMDVFLGYAESAPKGPESLNTRYIDEDVPMGLVLMHSLGLLSEVATPVCDSLVHLACALRGKNFWEEGRYISGIGTIK